MGASITVVDAFTDHAFGGNPASVCRLDAWPSDDWMQRVAAEMNHSETAFVVARTDGDYDLRWFTPTIEVALCGHATLATAFVLGGTPRFHTKSGVLACANEADGTVSLDLPADPVKFAPEPRNIRRILGTDEVYVAARSKSGFVLVELGSAAVVRELTPDMAGIASVDAPAVVVTASGDRDGIDCVSRFFGPRIGIPEDPVTGAAHCALALYWSDRVGRTELTGEQASKRGGIVGMSRRDDRVVLRGRAVTVLTGELRTPPA
ncbi:MAG: PhzF family phenazine biosynthesis protein [Acidimicrobiia bacterium]